MNLLQATRYLNEYCGYIDVEHDDDYTPEETIKIAEGHLADHLAKARQRYEEVVETLETLNAEAFELENDLRRLNGLSGGVLK